MIRRKFLQMTGGITLFASTLSQSILASERSTLNKLEESLMNQDLSKMIEAWALAWSSINADQLLSLFTDECLYEDMAYGDAYHGKAELKTFAEGLFAAFPDFKVSLTRNFSTGELGAAEWIMTGTHQGDMPGMPATNKTFSIRGASIFEFQSDNIKRCSDYWDQTAFLKQVGLVNAE